jgi:tetratricopeptide (TPR) repeat protein
MKRWIVAFLVMTLVATCGLALAQAGADQYRAAGDKYFAAKDYANAYKYYAYAAKMNPNDAAALKGVGNCLYMYQRKAQAIPYYEKSLALNPADTQLATFVQNLKAQVGAAPAAPAAAAPAAGVALAQGKALFQQKQYAAAVPVLQQAVRENPNDYQGYYLLGYSQYMTRDMKNAAVNFGLANAKQPNPQLKAYADRIKASLPPADQQWVDAQIASGGVAVAGTGAAGAAVKPKVFGIRLSPAVALFKLKDLEDEGAAIEAALTEANDAGTEAPIPFIQDEYFGTPGMYAMTGEVPSGNLYFGIEPVIRPAQGLEIAIGIGIFSVGKYSVDITSQNIDDPTQTDSIRKAYDVSTMPIGLSVGYAFGKGKVSPKIGLGADYYSVKIDETFSKATADPGESFGYTGEYKASGIGMHVDLGLDFKFGSSVVAGPYVRYRMAKFDSFTGTVSGNGFSESADLMVDNATGIVMPVLSGVPTTGMRPLEVDLGGVQVGLNIAAFF